jgi:phage terminase large subunit GpA-like protein
MLHQPIKAIPPFETGAALVRRAARLIRPKLRLSVSQWAIRYTGFDDEALPWQTEIMDALGDPETAEVGLMGPAQAGKSEIGNAWVGWSIEHDPADLIICQPDKAMADDYVKTRIAPMIQRTPELKAQLLPEVGADNIFLKQFRGMFLRSIWPVASQFRARPVPRGWLDDFDQIPDDIDGQGSAVQLLDARGTAFEGRETKFVSSSPAREDGGGIEAFVAGGTDERLMPVCPSCGERFEPDISRDLRFDAKGTPDQAEASAHVICPANGCILEPGDRRRLLDSLKELPNRGWVARNPDAGKRRRGFRVDGLLAFTTWGKLARQWREAQIAWEARQDETLLRAFMNVKGGRNYRSQLSGEKPLGADELKARREPGFASGTVPAGVKVLVRLVDVQANRFECMDFGFGDGLEGWLIRRWTIDVLGDGLTQVDPARHPEHWQVLLPLFSQGVPLADGSGRTVLPLTVAIDTGGADGVTDAAAKFWHAAVSLGVHPQRITLIKGGNKPGGKIMPPAQFADQKLKGGNKRNSARLWLPNVHAIKCIIDARLRRSKPGPGYIHLPGDLDDEHVDEMTAEQLEAGKWKKLRARNETWDLLVYAYAAILRPPFAQSRSDMRWVPKDFRAPKPVNDPQIGLIETNPPGREGGEPAPAAAATEPTEAAAASSSARKRRPMARRGGSWMGRLR